VPGTLPLAISLAVGQDVSRFYPPGVANSTENHFNLEYLALLAGGELGPHLAFLADYAPLFTISQTGKQLENHNLGLGFLQAHAEPRGWLVNVRAGLIELPTGTDDDFWSTGSFVEGEYRWTPSIVTLARGEVVATPTFDDRDRGGQTRIRRQVWTVTAGAQWLTLENLKLIVEGTYGENHEDVSNETTESWLVTVRVATAFWPYTPPALDLLLDAVGAS
jgi:hypothetical protein